MLEPKTSGEKSTQNAKKSKQMLACIPTRVVGDVWTPIYCLKTVGIMYVQAR